MDTIKLFTTHNVEGYKIESYLGMITANQVAGTGFLTDFIASFSDVLGGNSGAYRNEMNLLFSDVKSNLQGQANELGGNAIIGVSVDFDNISAKGMSMFMVSMQGTVVKITPIKNEQERKEVQNEVTSELLTLEYMKRVYKRKFENGDRISNADWKYILSHDMSELSETIYTAYTLAYHDLVNENAIRIKEAFPKYLSKLTYTQAVELAYRKDFCLIDLIKAQHLFNAKYTLEYAIQGKLDLVFELLESDKHSYSKTDLAEMRELAKYLQNLPDKGKMEEVKSGVFSAGGMKFVCECGKKNDKETEYCASCGKNIKGITASQKEQIDELVEKIDVLETLLNGHQTI